MTKSEHVYGRGKFTAHPDYVEYMRRTVMHPNYAGMPNATDPNGRINWQVSSGKATSFYKDYLARRNWWIRKADSLGLPVTDRHIGATLRSAYRSQSMIAVMEPVRDRHIGASARSP